MFANIFTGTMALFFTILALIVLSMDHKTKQANNASILSFFMLIAIATIFALLTSINWGSSC